MLPYLPLALATTTTGIVFADSAVSGQDGPTWLTLVNFGVLGLVLFFTFFRPKIHTDSEFENLKSQIADLKAEKDAEHEENIRLHKLIEEGVVPALSRSTDLIARSMAEREKRSGGS